MRNCLVAYIKLITVLSGKWGTDEVYKKALRINHSVESKLLF